MSGQSPEGGGQHFVLWRAEIRVVGYITTVLCVDGTMHEDLGYSRWLGASPIRWPIYILPVPPASDTHMDARRY